MFDLKNSVILMISFVIFVLGVSNIQYFEYNVLDFHSIFFVLLAIACLMGLLFTGPLLQRGVRVSLLLFLGFWAVVYGITWASYWRTEEPLALDILVVQFILLEVGAGLAYNAGTNIGQIERILEGLAVTTYPNRMKDVQAATERIKDELNRSRRYHHPLSLLVFKFKKVDKMEIWKQQEFLQKDVLLRFTIARIGQVISNLSRQTDIVLRGVDGQFIVLCPETEYENLSNMAERIRAVVFDKIGASLLWGSASFPDEALTFDDLLQSAENRIAVHNLVGPLESISSSDIEN